MRQRLHYGRGLAATVIAGIVAAVVMVVPAWLWSRYVLDVALDAVVGRNEGLDTSDRVFLYAGDLLLALVGFLVMAWITKRLYHAFQGADIDYWDTFQALVATAIIAALVAYVFPFLGLVIAVFAAPALVNGMAASAEDTFVAVEPPLPDPRGPLKPPV
jgi:hypothetical protein